MICLAVLVHTKVGVVVPMQRPPPRVGASLGTHAERSSVRSRVLEGADRIACAQPINVRRPSPRGEHHSAEAEDEGIEKAVRDIPQRQKV